MTLEEFYLELQEREGLSAQRLISPWEREDIANITNTLRMAVETTQIKAVSIPIRQDSTNQSVGNQVEGFVVNRLENNLHGYQILPCSGAGYPDKKLRDSISGKTFPFELKATSQWNPADSNRRVLTSSSRKIRSSFSEPINHILATLLYSQRNSNYFIDTLRLDFLEPEVAPFV